MAANAVPFRSTIFYTTAGVPASAGSVLTVGANGTQNFTGNLALNTLTASTMTGSTLSISTLSGSTITVSTLTGSTIQGTTVFFSTMTASTILTAGSTINLARNVNVPNRFVEVGSDVANSMYLDFHSSDAALPDYSTRIQSLNGATTGTGALNMYASTIGLMATNGVGIGTSSPQYALDVSGTSATRGVISAPTLSTGQFYNYTVTTTAGRWYKMISTPDFQSKVAFRVRGTVVSGTSPHSCSSIDILISTDNVSGSIYPQISQTDSYTAMSWTDFGLVYVMSTGYSTLYIKAATSNVIVNLDVSCSSKNGSIIPPLIYSSSSVYTLAFGGTMTTLIDTALTGSLSQFDIYTNANAKYNIMTNTNGYVGIGTTTPNENLTIYASSAPSFSIRSSISGYLQLGLATGVGQYSAIAVSGDSIIRAISGNLILQTGSGNAGIYINSSNNVGIGTTNPLYPLHVIGGGSSAAGSAINHSGSYYIQPLNGGGSAAATGSSTINGNVIGIFSYYAIVSATSVNAVYFSSYSDVRIKKNIQPLQYYALPLIEQFRIVSYDHVDKRNKPCGAGVIGQEMEAIFPSCIEKDAKVVPNIYERGVHTLEEDIICIRLISQDDQPVFKTDADIFTSRKISLRVVKQDKKEHIIDCDLLETDGAVFKVKKWDDYTADDLIFVYGTEVPDFLTVDKHMLSMLGLKGIQELSIKATSSASQIQELVGQTAQLTTSQSAISQTVQELSIKATSQASLVQELASQTAHLAAENTQLKSAIATQASAIALLEARLNAAGL